MNKLALVFALFNHLLLSTCIYINNFLQRFVVPQLSDGGKQHFNLILLQKRFQHNFHIFLLRINNKRVDKLKHNASRNNDMPQIDNPNNFPQLLSSRNDPLPPNLPIDRQPILIVKIPLVVPILVHLH